MGMLILKGIMWATIIFVILVIVLFSYYKIFRPSLKVQDRLLSIFCWAFKIWLGCLYVGLVYFTFKVVILTYQEK